MHNETNTNTHYGPIVGWGTKSTSNSYNSMYAYIVGKKTGQGADSNWNAGQINFHTAGKAVSYTHLTLPTKRIV